MFTSIGIKFLHQRNRCSCWLLGKLFPSQTVYFFRQKVFKAPFRNAIPLNDTLFKSFLRCKTDKATSIKYNGGRSFSDLGLLFRRHVSLTPMEDIEVTLILEISNCQLTNGSPKCALCKSCRQPILK